MPPRNTPDTPKSYTLKRIQIHYPPAGPQEITITYPDNQGLSTTDLLTLIDMRLEEDLAYPALAKKMGRESPWNGERIVRIEILIVDSRSYLASISGETMHHNLDTGKSYMASPWEGGDPEDMVCNGKVQYDNKTSSYGTISILPASTEGPEGQRKQLEALLAKPSGSGGMDLKESSVMGVLDAIDLERSAQEDGDTQLAFS